MFVYKNTTTGELLEFPDPQPALAMHSWWELQPEAAQADDDAPAHRRPRRPRADKDSDES